MKITAKRAAIMLLCALMISACALVIAEKGFVAESVQTSASVEYSDPVQKFRMERQQLRAMQKAQLNDIVHDSAADAETADLARRQLIEICRSEEMETTIEGILEMRGFSDPVATVHSGSVNILIRAEMITSQQSGVILDLVCRETGAMTGDIKIIPIN